MKNLIPIPNAYDAEQESNKNDLKNATEVQVEEALETAGLVEPLDGGYGWIIVLGSFLGNVIVEGTICVIGVSMQPQWESYFNSSAGATAFVVSLLAGIYSIVGPVAGALVDVFGCRKVKMVGSLIAFVGFMCSSIAPNLICLYFTFGVIGGIGFGLMYLPAIVIVGQYFDKRRALATCIASCGSGVGSFILTPFYKYLLTIYTWNQTLIIIAAIILNGLVTGALYRELSSMQPDAVHRAIEKVTDVVRQVSQTSVQLKDDEMGLQNPVQYFEKLQNEDSTILRGLPFLATLEVAARDRDNEIMSENVEMGSPDSQTPLIQIQEEQVQHNYSQTPSKSTGETQVSCTSSGTSRSNSEKRTRRFKKLSGMPSWTLRDLWSISETSVHRLNRPMAKKDVLFTGSRSTLDKLDKQRLYGVRRPVFETQRSISLPTLVVPEPLVKIEESVMESGTVFGQLKQALIQMADFSVLKSPTFVTLCAAGFLTMTGFYVPYVYLPRQAVSVGHSSANADFLICILGIVNIVARIACGWLSDHPNVDALLVRNILITMGGISTVLVPFIQSYWMFCIYCVLFGLTTAVFGGLNSVVCVELLGIDKLTSAFGTLLLSLGIATVIGSPLAGSLADLTGNYDLSWYIMGGLVTLSGIICFPLKAISRWESKRALALENKNKKDNNRDPVQTMIKKDRSRSVCNENDMILHFLSAQIPEEDEENAV